MKPGDIVWVPAQIERGMFSQERAVGVLEYSKNDFAEVRQWFFMSATMVLDIDGRALGKILDLDDSRVLVRFLGNDGAVTMTVSLEGVLPYRSDGAATNSPQ